VAQHSENTESAFQDLSPSEAKVVKAMASWSRTRILREHRYLVRLVSKVRKRLEQAVDDKPRGWVPDHDFSVCFAAVVGGGARLVDSYYKQEKSNPLAKLPEEALHTNIRHDLRILLEEADLSELETIVRRKRAELRQGKALAMPVIDVEDA
jgi:hypothetical protein